jgi:hypothetical protein|tara:strand:+ start:769 stop:903 length:135 start_codon:yes stop_codon:yes gene_type:complete
MTDYSSAITALVIVTVVISKAPSALWFYPWARDRKWVNRYQLQQ